MDGGMDVIPVDLTDAMPIYLILVDLMVGVILVTFRFRGTTTFIRALLMHLSAHLQIIGV